MSAAASSRAGKDLPGILEIGARIYSASRPLRAVQTFAAAAYGCRTGRNGVLEHGLSAARLAPFSA